MHRADCSYNKWMKTFIAHFCHTGPAGPGGTVPAGPFFENAAKPRSLVKLKEAAPRPHVSINWAARWEGPGQTHFCYNFTGIWTSNKHIHMHKTSIDFDYNNAGLIFSPKTPKIDNISDFLNATQNSILSRDVVITTCTRRLRVSYRGENCLTIESLVIINRKRGRSSSKIAPPFQVCICRTLMVQRYSYQNS